MKKILKTMLFENFNTTNQTILQFAAHEIFVQFVKFDGCSTVVNLNYSERCEFVKNEPSCSKRVRFLHYLRFMYCVVEKLHSIIVDWLYLILLAFNVFYMLQITGIITGTFFCEALNYVARSCRMSQSLAGSTIVAIGNAAGSFIRTFSDMNASIRGLYAGAYGAAIFQLTIVAGSILIISPLHIYPPIYTRDVIFLLTLITLINYMMIDETVNIYEASGLIAIYVLFLIIVVIDVIILKHISRSARRKMKLFDAGVNDPRLERELENLKNEGVIDILLKDSRSILDINTTKSDMIKATHANVNLFRQFIHSINPVDVDEWHKSNYVWRFMIVIKAPFFALFLILIPRIDYNLPLHGWSKLLNTAQLLWTPLFLLGMSDLISGHTILFSVRIFVYLFAISIPLMIIAFFTSRTDTAPYFHLLYAFFTLFVALILIQQCALEITSLSYTIGIAAKLSPSFLSVTISAWEGGLGALITNTTLALRGYGRMGFHGCYASPLFTIPLTFGIRLIYNVIKSKDGTAKVRQGPLGATIFTFIFLILLASYFSISLARFCARRSLGIYVIISYFLFLFWVVLTEFEYVHGHGTDHADQRVKMT